MIRFLRFYVLCLGVLLILSPIQAQVGTGMIVGSITDPSGATIAKAEVDVIDTATGFQRKVPTASDGTYTLPNLKPGGYRITATAPGFQTKTIEGVVIQVDDHARIDIVLQVGAITEQVRVEGSAVIVASENATIGEVVDTRRIVELPLNGRQYLQLALLIPGVQMSTANAAFYNESGGAFSANGLDPGSNTTMMDGVINMEFGAGRQNFSPSLDMIEEVKIQTNTYDATYGLSGATQVNVVTKRGSNDFHGSAYFFTRNSAWDARSFFNAAELPEFRRHQFGATVGGRIPKSHKDFFFFAYEGKRMAQGQTDPMNVPPLAIRNGDFSGTGTVIYDPSTLNAATGQRQPFPNSIIPQDRITQPAKFITQFWPAPTFPGLVSNFVSNPNYIINGNQYSIRYDRNFSEKDTLSVRYTHELDTGFQPDQRPGLITPVAGFGQNVDLRGFNLNSSWTHSFNPTTLNTFNFGLSKYQRTADNEGTVAGYFLSTGRRGTVSGPDFFQGAGIQGLPLDRQKAGLPDISVTGWSNIADDPFAPVREPYTNYVFSDTFSKVIGSHTVKAGFDIIRNRINQVDFEANTRGMINFGPNYTTSAVSAPGNQFNAFGDFLLGQVASSSLDGARLVEDLTQSWYMPYIQDDWKISKNLTVNVGLRYEHYSPMTEAKDRLVAYDLVSSQWVFAGKTVPTLPGTPSPAVTSSSLGLPRNMILGTRYGDFSPRVGFAWRVFGDNKTVLRGGYGIFYNWVTENVTQDMAFGPPWDPVLSITSNPNVPAVTFAQPYQTSVVPSTSAYVATAKTNKTPYVEQYSLSLGHNFSSKLGGEVSYVGNAGRDSLISYNYNQLYPGPGSVTSRRPYPAFGSLTGLPSWGTSNYNALQMKVKKDLGPEGLVLTGAYTYGKALATGVSGILFNGNIPYRDFRNWKADAGPTPFDVRHILSISWVYDIPVGRGKALLRGSNNVAQALVGGWKLGGIASYQSGHYVTPTDSFNNSNAGGSRPDAISNPNHQSYSSEQAMISRFFNTAAFVRATQYTFGNAGTGIIEGPGLQTIDLSLYKDFMLGERRRIQFRAEAFNSLNRANFDVPGTAFGTPGFGVITSTVTTPRQLQLGLRIDF